MEKLVESSVNPEDYMHSSYREHIVNYLIGLVSAKEAGLVVAQKGYGLSRLLRFIAFGNYPSKPTNIKLIYLNLLDFASKPLDTVIDQLKIFLKDKKIGESVCFLFDEISSEIDLKTLFKLLKGFRGKDKQHITFIIGLSLNENDKFKIVDPPSYILDLVESNIVRLPPLSQVDFYKVAEEMINKFGLVMDKGQLEGLYNQTKGVPSALRFELQNRFKAKFLDQSDSIQDNVYELSTDNGHVLCNRKRIDLELTKAEEQFLKLLIQKRGEVVHRDELGKLLAPESEGIGVSNESIDQVIYRLRKKLIKIGCKEKIETYVGRGYGLMG